MVAADVRWRSVSKASVECAQQAARAWDRYAEATGSSRTATKRQLLALTSMLEASILQERARTEIPLSDVIAEYERTKSGRSSAEIPIAVPDTPVARPSSVEAPVARSSSRERQDTGERDRTGELSERGGWAWLRPFRSYDEYEETLLRALTELDTHEHQLEGLRAR